MLADLLARFWDVRGARGAETFQVFDAIVRHVIAPHDPDQPVLWETPPEALDDDHDDRE